MKTRIIQIGVVSYLMPILAMAQTTPLRSQTFASIIYEIILFLDMVNPILIALAFILFFWGLSKFILSADNQAGIEKGRNYMLWGVLALFILLSFGSIASFISDELDLGGNYLNLPLLKTQ